MQKDGRNSILEIIVKLESCDGRTIDINVYAGKQETKDNLVLSISQYCPNPRVGYSGENMLYVKEEREKYKKK